MKTIKNFSQISILLCLLSQSVQAARIDDVKILDIKSSPDNIELKLHASGTPSDAYFFVDIIKSDRASFQKLVSVIKKMNAGEKHKLSLEIASFSSSPSGSYYRSPSVKFIEEDSAQAHDSK